MDEDDEFGALYGPSTTTTVAAPPPVQQPATKPVPAVDDDLFDQIYGGEGFVAPLDAGPSQRRPPPPQPQPPPPPARAPAPAPPEPAGFLDEEDDDFDIQLDEPGAPARRQAEVEEEDEFDIQLDEDVGAAPAAATLARTGTRPGAPHGGGPPIPGLSSAPPMGGVHGGFNRPRPLGGAPFRPPGAGLGPPGGPPGAGGQGDRHFPGTYVKPRYVNAETGVPIMPAGVSSKAEVEEGAAFPSVAAPGQPIKLPGQTRVTPEEYKEFLNLGHGEIFELDIDRVVDAPWRHPSADPGDYFNYSFNERTWKEYQKRVQRFRLEYTMQNKIQTFADAAPLTVEEDAELPPELAVAMAVGRQQGYVGGRRPATAGRPAGVPGAGGAQAIPVFDEGGSVQPGGLRGRQDWKRADPKSSWEHIIVLTGEDAVGGGEGAPVPAAGARPVPPPRPPGSLPGPRPPPGSPPGPRPPPGSPPRARPTANGVRPSKMSAGPGGIMPIPGANGLPPPFPPPFGPMMGGGMPDAMGAPPLIPPFMAGAGMLGMKRQLGSNGAGDDEWPAKRARGDDGGSLALGMDIEVAPPPAHARARGEQPPPPRGPPPFEPPPGPGPRWQPPPPHWAGRPHPHDLPPAMRGPEAGPWRGEGPFRDAPRVRRGEGRLEREAPRREAAEWDRLEPQHPRDEPRARDAQRDAGRERRGDEGGSRRGGSRSRERGSRRMADPPIVERSKRDRSSERSQRERGREEERRRERRREESREPRQGRSRDRRRGESRERRKGESREKRRRSRSKERRRSRSKERRRSGGGRDEDDRQRRR